MGVTVDLRGVAPKIKRICSNRNVGIFLASTLERKMNKYVPMDTGMLAQNVVVEPFRITYNQPYATKMYEGTNLNFSKEKHPLATSHWDKACMSANGEAIARELSAYIEGGNF